MRGCRQLRAKIAEDFTEDRNHTNNQKCRDGKGDAEDNDRISHRRFHFFPQARACFEKSSKPIENFSEQTAGFAGFDHAHKESVEDAGMFADRLVESFAALHARRDIADDMTQIALPFRIGLLVESCQSLDQ